MKRLWIIVAVVAGLLLQQSAMFARGSAPSDADSGLTHALMHWLDQQHHHHHDQPAEQATAEVQDAHDDGHAAQASLHVLTDLLHVPAMIAAAATQTPASDRPPAPSSVVATGHQSPFLEGLLRPPRG